MLLVFDLDGTLLDSKASIRHSIRFALSELGLNDVGIDEEKAFQQDLRTTLREAGAKYHFDPSPALQDKFVRLYREHNSLSPKETMQFFPDVITTLALLKVQFELAIATTKTTDQAVHILEALEAAHLFSHIQGTDSGLKYKPAPDILHAVLNKLRKWDHDSAYMGDSDHDIGAAKAAGMYSIGAAYGFCCPIRLKAAEPHHIVQVFPEIFDVIKIWNPRPGARSARLSS